MVNIEGIGLGLTLILLTTSVFMTAIALAEPGESFGINEGMNNVSIGDINVSGVMLKFNEDFETFSNSDGLNQIPLGATVIVTLLASTMQFFLFATLGWTVMIELMFGFSSSPIIIALELVLKIFFGIIIFITIANFMGRIVRGMPFFGGG